MSFLSQKQQSIEFKSEVEVKRPKSWLKTVSAFANGLGGSFYIGVDDNGHAIGLSNIKESSDHISRLIKERISPLPEFSLTAYLVEGGKEILVLQISHGETPPLLLYRRWFNHSICESRKRK